jgi:hypothetical protein
MIPTDGKVHFSGCPCPQCSRSSNVPLVGSVVFGPATITSTRPVTLSLDRDTMTVDQLKDAVQFAFNCGAYKCPLAGKEKPVDHASACLSCRIRKALSPERYLKPDEPNDD